MNWPTVRFVTCPLAGSGSPTATGAPVLRLTMPGKILTKLVCGT
jgi:hypothetical protein